MLRPDGTPVSDLLSAPFLKDLHIKIAFVSCAGYTPEAGLTERDMREAQLKTGLLAAAQEVVALVDSSKFGKTSLSLRPRRTGGAPVHRQRRIARRGSASSSRPVPCSPFAPRIRPRISRPAQETRHYRIGFANLGENMPFPVDVRRGLERAAQAAGNIDLVVADNQ